MNFTDISFANFKAAIFDMDGTMIANTAFHQRAWQTFLERHNISLSKEEFDSKMTGKKNDQLVKGLFGNQLSEGEINAYADEKEAIYRELYAKDITEVKGLSLFIEKLQALGLKTAVATTAPKKNRDFALQALGLTDKFEIIMGDEHTLQGKPHPEIYLNTAKSLGILPSECIAFEDSPSGVASAKAAGMKVVGILTYHTKEDLNLADYWVSDFSQINIDTQLT